MFQGVSDVDYRLVLIAPGCSGRKKPGGAGGENVSNDRSLNFTDKRKLQQTQQNQGPTCDFQCLLNCLQKNPNLNDPTVDMHILVLGFRKQREKGND